MPRCNDCIYWIGDRCLFGWNRNTSFKPCIHFIAKEMEDPPTKFDKIMVEINNGKQQQLNAMEAK